MDPTLFTSLHRIAHDFLKDAPWHEVSSSNIVRSLRAPSFPGHSVPSISSVSSVFPKISICSVYSVYPVSSFSLPLPTKPHHPPHSQRLGLIMILRVGNPPDMLDTTTNARWNKIISDFHLRLSSESLGSPLGSSMARCCTTKTHGFSEDCATLNGA